MYVYMYTYVRLFGPVFHATELLSRAKQKILHNNGKLFSVTGSLVAVKLLRVPKSQEKDFVSDQTLQARKIYL